MTGGESPLVFVWCGVPHNARSLSWIMQNKNQQTRYNNTASEWLRSVFNLFNLTLNQNTPDVIICVMDITNEWKRRTDTPGTVIMRDFYVVGGVTYRVDGKKVVLHPSQHEIDVAMVLCQEYGKTIEMIPRINFPEGIQTPDYLINGERYDLKSPMDELERQSQDLFRSPRTAFLNIIVFLRDRKVLKVLQRKQ